MSERIEDLKAAVEEIHLEKVEHVESVPIVEMFRTEMVWEGVVEVFRFLDYPKIERCYAWRLHDGTQYHYATVLEIPPVKDARTAVQAWVMASTKSRKPAR